MLQAAAKGGAGGLVTKTISVDPADVPRPCMAEIRGGFLNTELWSELPKEQWIETEYKLAAIHRAAGDRRAGLLPPIRFASWPRW